MWLEGEMNSYLVIFSLGEYFYEVHYNGNVFKTASTDPRFAFAAGSMFIFGICIACQLHNAISLYVAFSSTGSS